MFKEIKKNEKSVFFVITILAVVIFSGGGFLYYRIANGIIQNITDLEAKILTLEEENINLNRSLKKEQQKNFDFATQIEQIAGTVGKLDKLSKTDKELLQKYSKVYFLNENYTPLNLTEIPADCLFDKDKVARIHAKVLPYLQELITEAKSKGVELKIISAFRSFGEQNSLKGAYTMIYGSGANKFSADQGFSEHQLGTTVDFTTTELGSNFNEFGKTEAYKWLLENAYKYGFILSYPKGNVYYQFEPWHWRFVGRSLAKRLYEERQNFYDLSQRNIDNYLISIFD